MTNPRMTAFLERLLQLCDDDHVDPYIDSDVRRAAAERDMEELAEWLHKKWQEERYDD